MGGHPDGYSLLRVAVVETALGGERQALSPVWRGRHDLEHVCQAAVGLAVGGDGDHLVVCHGNHAVFSGDLQHLLGDDAAGEGLHDVLSQQTAIEFSATTETTYVAHVANDQAIGTLLVATL